MQRLTHEDSEHWISDTNIALVQSLLNEQSPPPLQAHSFTCIEPLRLTQLLTNGTYNYERVRRYFHTAQTNSLLYDTIYMTLNTTSIGGILRSSPSSWFQGFIDEVADVGEDFLAVEGAVGPALGREGGADD